MLNIFNILHVVGVLAFGLGIFVSIIERDEPKKTEKVGEQYSMHAKENLRKSSDASRCSRPLLKYF